jgi:Uma2 family endonuclease
VTRIDRRLTRLLPDEWIIRCQCAATLLDSEPEPDIVVVPGPEETWFERHPGPKDILLVIEVADASLARDRTVKAEIYARAHIPVYWIVNLTDNWIEEYTQPRGGKNAGYRKRQDLRKGNVIAIPIPDLETDTVPVSELLR